MSNDDFRERTLEEVGELFANHGSAGHPPQTTAVSVIAKLLLWAKWTGTIDPHALIDLAEADFQALDSPPPPLRGVGECQRCGERIWLRPLDPANPKPNEWLDENHVDGCGDTPDSHQPDTSELVTVSLVIGNHYELHDAVVTRHDNVLVPRYEGGALDEWGFTWLFDFTGVGHLDGESHYRVEMTASSQPELTGTIFEF